MQLVRYAKTIYDINDFQEKLDIVDSKYDLIISRLEHLNNQYDVILETYQDVIDLLDSLNFDTSIVDYINQLGYFSDFKLGLNDGINNIPKKQNMKEYYYFGYEVGVNIKDRIGKIHKLVFTLNPNNQSEQNLFNETLTKSLDYYYVDVVIDYIRMVDLFNLSNNVLIKDKKSYRIINNFKQPSNNNYVKFYINRVGNSLNRIFIDNTNYVYIKGVEFIVNASNIYSLNIQNTPIHIYNSNVVFEDCKFTATPNSQNSNSLYWFILNNNSNIEIINCIFSDGNNITAIYNMSSINNNIEFVNNSVSNINKFQITNSIDLYLKIGKKEW